MAFLIVPLLAIPVLSIVAVILSALNRSKVDECCRRIDELSERLARMERPVAPVPAAEPPPEPVTSAAALSTPPTPLPPADVSAEAAVEPPPAAPEPSSIEPPPAMPWIRSSEPAPEFDLWARIEEHVGKRWMSWAGALALFLGVGFFVKYAIDRQWIGPTARVCLGAAFGVVLIVLGCRSLRRKMRALGQGLVGGGLAILYVSLFAAFEFYGLIPQSAAFVLMVLVSALGMTLAAVHNAPPIAVLAILGGFLTPRLVSTGRDERDILFAYILLLDVSVLVLGYFRKWRLIEMLAFIGTAVLFSQWFDRFYSATAMLPTLIWVGMFYVVFAIAPFFAHLVKKTPVAVERFLMTIAATLGAFGFAHRILYADHPHALGFIAMAMGACSLALGILFRKRIPGDNRSSLGHFALAMFFLTVSIPIHFGLNATTLCWAAEGPLLLYLGYTFRYRPARLGGLTVLIISAIRLFAVHMPLHVDSFTLFLNTQFGTAMSVPVACGLFALIHHLYPSIARKDEALQKIAVGIAGGFLALIILHVEMHQWFEYRTAALGLLRHYHAWAAACVRVQSALACCPLCRSRRSARCNCHSIAVVHGTSRRGLCTGLQSPICRGPDAGTRGACPRVYIFTRLRRQCQEGASRGKISPWFVDSPSARDTERRSFQLLPVAGDRAGTGTINRADGAHHNMGRVRGGFAYGWFPAACPSAPICRPHPLWTGRYQAPTRGYCGYRAALPHRLLCCGRTAHDRGVLSLSPAGEVASGRLRFTR